MATLFLERVIYEHKCNYYSALWHRENLPPVLKIRVLKVAEDFQSLFCMSIKSSCLSSCILAFPSLLRLPSRQTRLTTSGVVPVEEWWSTLTGSRSSTYWTPSKVTALIPFQHVHIQCPCKFSTSVSLGHTCKTSLPTSSTLLTRFPLALPLLHKSWWEKLCDWRIRVWVEEEGVWVGEVGCVRENCFASSLSLYNTSYTSLHTLF